VIREQRLDPVVHYLEVERAGELILVSSAPAVADAVARREQTALQP
jgi:hypothetical protein